MPHLTTLRVSSFLAIVIAAAAGCSKTADKPSEAPAAAAPAPAAEAPPPAAKSANVHAFQVGELSAMTLMDGNIELPNDNKVFGMGRTPEEVAALLSANGLPTDKLQLTIKPLLVKTADKVLLFDTGAASNFGPSGGKLPASLAEAGIDPQSVTDIFISHAHGDHVGGLVNAEGALAFPNATIHISKPEWKFMSGAKEEWQKKLVATVTPKVQGFDPGAELVPGVVTAVDVKGHTPGHSAYKITSGSESLLYVGDSMHHYVVSVQKPEWQVSFDADHPVASKSRADLIAASAAGGQRIYAVHFPFPGIGKFEKQGDTHVWVAE
jgi:glyoxylase-like metal-dependent hydrolase (beta-lactamase superfamily II)